MNSFTVATFNINKNDGGFPKRIFELEKQLHKFHMDFLCLQEDFTSQNFSSSNILNNHLSFFKTSIKTRAKKRDGVMSNSNLTILSKIEPINVDSLYFDELENEQRAVLFCVFLFGGAKILVANTHLCHISTTNRLYQLKRIIDYIKKSQIENVLLCGDLNSSPDSREMKFLQKNGYLYKNSKITSLRGQIIDYITFYGKVKCINSDIILQGYSDHYCLINSFDIQ